MSFVILKVKIDFIKGNPLKSLKNLCNQTSFLSKSAQFVIGLALSFVLTLPSLANQATVTADGISQNQAIAMAGGTQTNEDLLVLRELQKAQRQAQNQTQTATAEATHTPRQSTAPAISHDKLILNNPVIDEAHILTASEKTHLETQLRQIYEDKLAQMAVVIVPTTEGVDIFDYAYQVAKRWELGDKERDDGILMAVAINDRKLHIVTGYGVEGVLPDAIISRIIREDITPSFKTGAYAQGISAGIARIDERLRADPETLAKADKAQKNTGGDEVDVLGLLIPAFIVGLFISGILGRFLGASISAGGFAFIAFMSGLGLFGVLVLAFILWVAIIIMSRGGMIIPTGGGGFGGGSFGGGSGGGGFGGFGGGGGGFGGGGAGGSW